MDFQLTYSKEKKAMRSYTADFCGNGNTGDVGSIGGTSFCTIINTRHIFTSLNRRLLPDSRYLVPHLLPAVSAFSSYPSLSIIRRREQEPEYVRWHNNLRVHVFSV